MNKNNCRLLAGPLVVILAFVTAVSVALAQEREPRSVILRDGAKLSSAQGSQSSDQPLALASADFDEDGVPDLIASYASAQGALVVVRRGNVDAIYPNSPEAKVRKQNGQFTEAAFLAVAGSIALPEVADLIGAGDFDADGHWDIVGARTGGDELFWLRGDGRGNFSTAQVIELHGTVTALVTGEMNRADGLTDIAVGFIASDGPRALVFESPEGALRGAPESFKLSAPASALALGQLDDDYTPDLAIAAGNEITIIHGRDRKLSLDAEQRTDVKAAQLSRSTVQSAITSIAVGDFAGDDRSEIAALMADGKVCVLERRSDTSGFQASDLLTLNVAEKASGNTSSMRLLAAKVSSLPKDDLVIFGGSNVRIMTTREADLFDGSGKLTKAGSARMSMAASLPSPSEVTAVLPMRLNRDALKDLVVLNKNSDAPIVIVTQPAATYVVNVTGNSSDVSPGNGVCLDNAGNCTFSAAIQEANAHAGADTIEFNIPGAGLHTVSPNGRFFTDATTVDGTTQPGGRVEVASGDFSEFLFYGGNSVVRGVAAYFAPGGAASAIYLASSGNVVEGNYIGFKADETLPSNRTNAGISFRAEFGTGHNNLIGGTTAQARNVISNCNTAVYLSNGASGNTIRGNYIGTNVAGTAAVPNFNEPIRDTQANGLTIGGTAAGAGNVISGNTDQGRGTISIENATAALVQGNFIGTTADGMQPLSNSGVGISLGVAPSGTVTIGGTTPASRNVISANSTGIVLYPHGAGPSELVQGNFIGTNAAGTGALPNLGPGVRMAGNFATLGGAASGAGNLISGNGGDGVLISPDNGNSVQGNFIGTDVTGTVAIPNFSDGVEIQANGYNQGRNNLIGGTSAGARNVISGNRENGIRYNSSGDAGPNRAEGNYIGVNRFGTGALANGQHGVFLQGTPNNVGGSAPGAGNLIAFNGGDGIASSGGNFYGAILSNSIFSNAGLGIDRGNNGVNPYQPNEAGQAPVITAVDSSDSETTITGKLRTRTDGGNLPQTIQFFSSSSPDPSGYGEGQTFVGETTISAGSNTDVSFTVVITPPVPPGRYISAVAVGQGDTNNPNSIYSSEFSFCVRVAGVATPENTPLHLNLATPSGGGNLGDVSITISGEGIAPGATVALRRAGMPDIASQSLVVSSSGDALQATFALAGQSIGQWDIVVTNPDGTSFVLAGSFQIVQGVDADVWVDVIGRSNARPNRPQTYLVVFGNRANTDAYGVPLDVSMPPATSFKILSQTGLVTLDDIDPNHEAFDAGQDISQYDSFLDFDDARVSQLLIPVIPAGTTGVIEIQMTFPDIGEGGTLEAVIGQPFLESTVAPPNSSHATNSGNVSPMATPPPGPLEQARKVKQQFLKELGDRHIKSNGDIDIDYFLKQKGIALQAQEENYSNETKKALNKADAQLLLAYSAQGAVTIVKTRKEVLGAKDQVAGGPKGYVKDKVKGWAIDKAVKSIVNAGDIPAIAADFYKVMRDLINRNTPKPVVKIIKWVRSLDPNDKAGSSGGGTQHFITGSKPIPYGIFFENKPEASAPAQEVVITDQLDASKLDLETLQWGTVGFGTDTIVTPPPNGVEWAADADLRPTNNLIVRVSASLDKTTGILTWRFVSIDPATNQPTTDPEAGFLPPDEEAPEGQGWVSFIIAAKGNQPDGTEIRNKARIVFDTNAPLDTPEWLNTIDHTPPSSEVLPLPSTTSAARFEVQWSGSDAAAGVAHYTIYVSENGGAFTPWLVNTTATSAVFQGRPGTTYTFYSVATDGAGNIEAAPLSGDASTSTLAGQLLNIATRLRVQTGENVLIGGLIVTGTEPKKVIIRGIGPSLSNLFAGALADPKLELYQGNTLLASNDNWKDSQQAEIEASTIPPTNDFESAIVWTLAPGSYTAILSGSDGGTGIGVVEAYDLDQAANSKLANIATRGFVDAGDNVMIGGVIPGGNGGADTRVLIRAIGPSLTNFGINGALQDPTLELRDANGGLLRENDNWQADQQDEIEATTIPPTNAAESAIVATLAPGNYTAIVRGKNEAIGVALVEVYNLQ